MSVDRYLLKNILPFIWFFIHFFVSLQREIKCNDMNTVVNKHNDAYMALKKAMEVRRVWMQALSGRIGKEELEAKGIRFMSVKE